ncbi:MAG: hypothetical protein HOP19_29055 [Acidobacteria bacterium]|nr:hypothetical protein [Acidobacteriota bacterium]
MAKQFFNQLNSFSKLIIRAIFLSWARWRYGVTAFGILAISGGFLFIHNRSAKAQMAEDCNLDVEVSYYGRMCAQNAFTISLNGSSTGAGGINCATFTQTPTVKTRLILNKPYPFVAASGICSTHVYFDVPPGYTMEIDGDERTMIHSKDGIPGDGDGTWQVVVKKECACDDETQVKLDSVNWSLNLGKLQDGRSAESIHLREKMLSATIYTPAALIYSPPGVVPTTPPLPNPVDVVTVGGVLRQIYAPENLADIVTINANEYEIRLYKPADVGAKTGGYLFRYRRALVSLESEKSQPIRN